MTKTGVVIYCENVLKDLMTVKETSTLDACCVVLLHMLIYFVFQLTCCNPFQLIMIALKFGGQLCKYLSFPDLFVSEMKTLCRQGRVGRAI